MKRFENEAQVDKKWTPQQGDKTDHRYGMLTGMFPDRPSAERAYDALYARGYTKDDIDLVMSDQTRKRYFSDVGETEIGTKAAEGAGKGGAIGGTVGAIAGVVAAIGTSIVIPGLGLVVAGPIAAGLAGAGAGGITGGIIGALVGSGIPEERARLYESGVKNGKVVVGVHPRTEDDAKYFERDWRTHEGVDVYR
jgi:hypothetical protein